MICWVTNILPTNSSVNLKQGANAAANDKRVLHPQLLQPAKVKISEGFEFEISEVLKVLAVWKGGYAEMIWNDLENNMFWENNPTFAHTQQAPSPHRHRAPSWEQR